MAEKAQESVPPTEKARRGRFGSVISTRPLPIGVERPPPWNRWLFRAVHYWRYGYSHPDEDLLGVIDAVGDALHVQVISARSVLTGESALEADRIKAELELELDKRPPDFSTLLGFEARINALYPPALARLRRWAIRERFERIAPAGALQHWGLARMSRAIAGPPPGVPGEDAPATGGTGGTGGTGSAGGPGDPGGGGSGGGQGQGGGPHEPLPGEGPAAGGDSDSQALLNYIHTHYLMTIGREKAVRDLKRWLLMRFWLFLVVLVPILFGIWIVLWLNDVGQYWGLLLGLFLIAAAGRAGATTSIIRRLQHAISTNVLAADPIVELTALRTGKNEISMALTSSSIFALLMWAFFASGVPELIGLEGGLFPRAYAAAPASEDAPDNKEPAAAPAPGPAPVGAIPPKLAPGAVDEPPAPAATAPEPEPVLPVEPQASAAGPVPDGERAAATVPRPVEDEERVAGEERAFRAEVADLRAATGLDDWFERRRIRQRARLAIERALAAQQEVIAYYEARKRAGDPNDAKVQDAERALEAATRKRDELENLATNLAHGGMGPESPGLTCPPGKTCNPFAPLATSLRLQGEADFFKMLLWAFIAGFAERFVPDMLDRVVLRGRGAALSDSGIVLATEARSMARGGVPPPAPPTPPAPRARDRGG
ncbi:hypothetical protein [Sphingosinicella terrae]|uniref:hypothetical protein n=1 Tax=Sphingosinicella terrae TaxID=2172047 RepID=UPI000E0D0EBB|nr:hypothetical protein [Sphingosinicella terrae]